MMCIFWSNVINFKLYFIYIFHVWMSSVCMCMCVRARACVYVFVCVYVHACMRACVRACVRTYSTHIYPDNRDTYIMYLLRARPWILLRSNSSSSSLNCSLNTISSATVTFRACEKNTKNNEEILKGELKSS